MSILRALSRLGLKAGIVGAFNNKQIIKTIGIPANHDPLLIMPVAFPG